MKIVAVLSLFFLGIAGVLADTPANCTYEDVQGQWIFQETERSANKSENCDVLGPVVNQVELLLDFPDVATDQYGNIGHWTLIYNQGFEVRINQRKYFAFSYYEQSDDIVTSYCHKTFNGWSHDILVRNWACYLGNKVEEAMPKAHRIQPSSALDGKKFHQDDKFVDKINSAQKSWTAKMYDKFEGMALEDYQRMVGGKNSRIFTRPTPAPVTDEVLKRTAVLPESIDWRDYNGQSFVTPVRDQAQCGSCYAFSATAMVEARLKVLTNNSANVILSPQDVVSCSEYAQGCDGGFPYLIGGKYAQDFGLVEEACYPYEGRDTTSCAEAPDCLRHYVSAYNYLGGFYGACNEELMKEALVNDGPLSVSFEVYDDFSYYTGGIYHHVEGVGQEDFNPFEITNHAVLLVGYGADTETGEKYWTIKNSWGATWGESGYFRIRRGTDECSIESLAVEVLPIP